MRKVQQGNTGDLVVAKAKRGVGRGHKSGEAGQCPSTKSVKKVCAKVKEQTLSIFRPVKNEEVVQRVNKILVGWGNYFQCGYPRKANI